MLLNPPPRKKRMGYVYLLRSGDYHKIGLTRRDINKRTKEITVPEGLSVVHVVETEDPEGLEAYLHNEFKKKRTEREWFKLDEEDVQFIMNIKGW